MLLHGFPDRLYLEIDQKQMLTWCLSHLASRSLPPSFVHLIRRFKSFSVCCSLLPSLVCLSDQRLLNILIVMEL